MPEFAPDQRKLMYDVLYGEAGGGSDEEKIAVISTILNRLDNQGFPDTLEEVLKGYSSYSTKSKQYIKAKTGKLNTFEKKVYRKNRELVDQMIDYRIERIPEITHFENVDRFGQPPWAGEVEEVGKFGRQMFYKPKGKKPRARALGGPVAERRLEESFEHPHYPMPMPEKLVQGPMVGMEIPLPYSMWQGMTPEQRGGYLRHPPGIWPLLPPYPTEL